MHVKQNSVTVEERLEDQSPYKLWDADLYECPECGVEIITGFGQAPLAEHWQPTYAAQRARLEPIVPGRHAMKLPRVQIVNPTHPHVEEYGRFTGKIITMRFGTGEQMAEIQLEHCRHGTDSCFVSKGDVVQVAERDDGLKG